MPKKIRESRAGECLILMFREGQLIGPYLLVARIGRGGFGEVWLAEKRSPLVTKFSEGLAWVKLGGKWELIDTTGKEVIPFKYDEAVHYGKSKGQSAEDFYKVKRGGKSFFVGKDGTEYYEP